MPTIARIREGKTIRKHENKYGPGITPHYLETDQVGVVEFDSTLFTAAQANEWLTAHDYKQFTIAEGKEQADNERKHRFLSIELAPSSDIQEIDGGLLVPGVRLLAPGTWTDSTQKTPCRYTAEILERFCSNWTDRSYWSRHSGGTPRDITDRIADIRNLRYDNGVTADLFFHGATSKSLDAISLIKAAQAGKVPWPYSSVEMMTRDKWIVSEKIYEAQEILFDGSAMVNQGACRTCKIRNNAGVWEEVTPEIERSLEQEITEAEMDEKELTAKFEAQSTQIKELAELIKAMKPAETPAKSEILKELSDEIAALKAENKTLSEQIRKLAEAPPPAGETPARELSYQPEFYVQVDRKAGTVGGE